MPALVVGQSGGVTPVINASLAGVIAEAQASARIGPIYGLRHGVRGLLENDLVRLDGVDETFLERLSGTPGAWLGSCRHAPDEAELQHILDFLVGLDARFYVYAGGNDSADTSARLAALAVKQGRELHVVNVPKTIDNDLPDMDHCPGYATAAAFVALAVRLLCLDTAAMRREEPLRVVEVKGRHSGWLAAAATAFEDDGAGRPILAYLPERPLRTGRVLADVDAALSRAGYAVLVVSEHALGEDGQPVGQRAEAYVDAFGHADSLAPGAWLQSLLESELMRRCRLEVLGALQKVALLPESTLDQREAFDAGRHAVRAALAGESGRCVTLNRGEDAAYAPSYGLTDLGRVARLERLLPAEFIEDEHPSEAFGRWLRPLVEESRPLVQRLLDPADK